MRTQNYWSETGRKSRFSGKLHCRLLFAVTMLLAACTNTIQMPSSGPVTTTITVVKRGWHTDICVRSEDTIAWTNTLSYGFEEARFLCFGFGERQYVLTRNHGLLALLSALLPSQAALLMTGLRDTPGAAFGVPNVVSLGVSRAGLTRLEAFINSSTQIDSLGKPIRLGKGPYLGSVFFGATGTYDGLYTCNTWTADALRSAGLPVNNHVLFAGALMYQVQQLAAARVGGAL